MDTTKQKYVKVGIHGDIIIFPCTIEHSAFKHLSPVSAGFCYVESDKNRVTCFGRSHSLNMESDPNQDSQNATKQIFGFEALLELMSNY